MNYKDSRISLTGHRGSMLSLGSEYPSLRLLLAPSHDEQLSLQEAFIGCRMLQIFDSSSRALKFYFLSSKFNLLLHVALLRRTSAKLSLAIFAEEHSLPQGVCPQYDQLVIDQSVESIRIGETKFDESALHVIIADPQNYDKAIKLFNPKAAFWFLLIDYAFLKQTPVAATFRGHGLQMCENAEGCGEVFRL
jgi:hypothetical protein